MTKLLEVRITVKKPEGTVVFKIRPEDKPAVIEQLEAWNAVYTILELDEPI